MYEAPRGLWIGRELLMVVLQPAQQNLLLARIGEASARAMKGEAKALFRGGAAVCQHELSQRSSRFHIGEVVHQFQRLQRRIGARALNKTDFTARRVER